MELKTMKRITGEIVKGSEMSTKAKIQLFNYIKEATVHQIIALLLDGTIVNPDEEAQEILESRFLESDILDFLDAKEAEFKKK